MRSDGSERRMVGARRFMWDGHHEVVRQCLPPRGERRSHPADIAAHRKGTASDAASLTASSASGAALTSGQEALNKVATLAGVLAISHFLSPGDYGVAATALAVTVFLRILPVEVFGDVLVASGQPMERVGRVAQRLAFAAAGTNALLTLMAIPLLLAVYGEFPALWLGSLLAALALRPVLVALAIVPVSDLRLRLHFGRVALVDGLAQLGATLASVAMAMAGARAAALVAPQLANQLARAILYRTIAKSRMAGKPDWSLAPDLWRRYLAGAGGQYAHAVLIVLPVSVVGFVGGDKEAGFYGFAYMFASQAIGVVALRLGFVMQPIFVRLREDPGRQREAFLRVQRIVGAVCVPLAMLQFALAEPFFGLVLADDWAPAMTVFQALSVMYGFYFAINVGVACLSAQRRFGTLFVWQGTQLVVSLGVLYAAASFAGALGAAVAAAATWAASAVVVIGLCVRSARRALGAAFRVFGAPWGICLLVFVPGYAAVQWLDSHGATGQAVALVVVGPLLFLAALALQVALHRELRQPAADALSWVWRRLGVTHGRRSA